jgi:chitodextrinase
LPPETTYTFTIRAEDFAHQWSPLSDPATVTTRPINADDHTPPTPSAPLYGQNGACEVELTWTESTDDSDPQWIIEYQIYVNGVYDHSLSLRYTRTIVYGTHDGLNEFSVIAVDTAGNKSEPVAITLDLYGCS